MFVVVFYVRPDDHFRRQEMQPPDLLHVSLNHFIVAAARWWEFQGPHCASMEFTSYKGFIHIMTPEIASTHIGCPVPYLVLFAGDGEFD